MVKEGIMEVHLVSESGVEVDKEKFKVIEKLTLITSTREVIRFLVYASFYWWFIKDFSKISKLLFSLLKKDVEFNFHQN